MLKIFNMLDYNIVVTPAEWGQKREGLDNEERVNAIMYKQIIGSLRYLCNN